MADITYKILKNIVTVPADTIGWTLELNYMTWGNNHAKYDLRKWNEDHSRSSKGVTFTEDEAVLLFKDYKSILESITGEKLPEGGGTF